MGDQRSEPDRTYEQLRDRPLTLGEQRAIAREWWGLRHEAYAQDEPKRAERRSAGGRAYLVGYLGALLVAVFFDHAYATALILIGVFLVPVIVALTEKKSS